MKNTAKAIKKVLIVSHTANFQKFNRPFIDWFKQQGWQVDYLSSNEEPIKLADNIYEVKITRSPVSLANLKAISKTRRIMKQNSYDLVHCHTPMGGVVARLAAASLRKKGLKVIYTAHGFHFFKGAPRINWLIYYTIEKLLSKLTDALVTINGEDYQLAKDKFSCRVYQIDGVGVQVGRFKPASQRQRNALRKANGYQRDDRILINVGELNKNKNQDFIIDSLADKFRQDDHLKLLICGTGDTESALRQKVKQCGLSHQIKLAGYVKNVDELYQMSDVLLSVSHREGLPINIVEAMATGLPIVATNIRGCRDVVTDSRNGFLIPIDDQDQLIKSLDKLAKEKTTQKIKANNLKDVKKYSVERAVENMAKIYQEVLDD